MIWLLLRQRTGDISASFRRTHHARGPTAARLVVLRHKIQTVPQCLRGHTAAHGRQGKLRLGRRTARHRLFLPTQIVPEGRCHDNIRIRGERSSASHGMVQAVRNGGTDS